MEALFRETRFALRALRKRPVFTAIAVLSLALGIGANSTIFTMLNGLLFRPLPGIQEPDRLARIYNTTKSFDWPIGVSYPDYEDLEQSLSPLVDNTAGHLLNSYGVKTPEDTQPRVGWGVEVVGDYFGTLGVTPSLGRFFSLTEDTTREPFLVASHRFWLDRLDGDPSAIGKNIELNGQSFTVIGVAPEGFVGTEAMFAPEFWVPLKAMQRMASSRLLEDRESASFKITARMSDGTRIEDIEQALAVLSSNLSREHPETHETLSLHAMPDRDARIEAGLGDAMRLVAAVLFSLVALVLLIACGNVANLMLARASGRRKELSIRLAIGAGRSRLVRQLLLESLLVALGGGLGGLLLALGASRLVSSLSVPSSVPVRLDMSPDASILGFTLVVSVLAGLLFGILPAWQASRQDPARGLREAPNAGAGKTLRLGGAFVVTQVATSLVLLVAAGLFLRSLGSANEVDIGMEPEKVAALSVNYSMLNRPREEGEIFFRQVQERMAEIPGVDSVSVAASPPMDWNANGDRFGVGRDMGDELGDELLMLYSRVDTNYFETIGTPILEGRAFTNDDDAEAEQVVIVNQKLAEMVWPEESALGKQLRFGGREGTPMTVIGVAKNGKYRLQGETQRPYLYMPFKQHYTPFASFIARTERDPRSILAQAEDAVHEFAPDLALQTAEPLQVTIDSRTTVAMEIMASLATSFGLIGLILASIGLYGVMAYSVSQRTRELGVRIALGASQKQVLTGVLRKGIGLAVIGVALGAAIALALTRVLRSLLVGVSASDPLTFAVVLTTLLAVAALATLVPAVRATRIDPVKTLKAE